jgi:hypothetical protein
MPSTITSRTAVHHIGTGSLLVDGLLSGGWLRGSICEVWGGPGTGKTTLAQHCLDDLDPDENALWVSVGSEVPHRSINASVVAPRSAEDAFEAITAALYLGAALVVVDSANGLVRAVELEEDSTYVPSPHREFKPELDELRHACEVTNGTVLFLSKPRDTERAPIRGTGVSEKAKQRVTLKIVRSHQNGDVVVEASLKSGDYVEYTLRPGSGIDWAEDILVVCVEHDIVAVQGSWYFVRDRKVQGKAEMLSRIRTDPSLAAYLATEARRALDIE